MSNSVSKTGYMNEAIIELDVNSLYTTAMNKMKIPMKTRRVSRRRKLRIKLMINTSQMLN
jgi:hypothetical protein